VKKSNSFVVILLFLALPVFAQNLEIHEINVGWGSSTYLKAPNGKTVLLDAGDTGMGTAQVKPYLASISTPTLIDVVIGSHQHCDHIGGLDEIIGAGYTAGIQYYNGSTYSNSCATGWLGTAPAPVRMPVNTVINLGTGCSLICVGNWDQSAGNYEVCDGTRVSGVSNENDKSIAILVSCNGFHYLWAGDLGGGNTDQFCIPGRSTTQADVETYIINGIIAMGYAPQGGIDILHVNHHGSESSTNYNYKNLGMPEYAICAVGRGQTAGWALPRVIPFDEVLLGGATSCINAPATVKIFQTEEGDAPTADQSYSGYCLGDIVVTFDPSTGFYCIDADGAVDYGSSEYAASGLPICQASDGGAACTPPAVPGSPTVTDINTCVQSGVQISWTIVSGATGYDLHVDSSTTIADVTTPYTYNPGDTNSHTYQIRSKNGPTCTSAWSTGVSGVDIQGVDCTPACTAPAAEVIETVNADKSGFKWTNIAGADDYRVVRGLRSNLASLITGAAGFSCYQYGIASGATGVAIGADDPSVVTDRCYYYLIQGYDCSDPNADLDTAGNSTAGQRIINLSANCLPACAANSASITSVLPSGTVTVGTQQTFSGSGTGEGALAYQWDFSYDGITFNTEAAGSSINYTYAGTGAYTAALRVTDSCANPSAQQAINVTSITINPSAAPAKVVLSQIYGGGGNAGAPYANDFIELFNSGGTPQDLTGWAVQYAPATSGTWSATGLSGTIPAGGYYLIQEGSGGSNGVALPIPDATGTTNMSATAGKVALTNEATALSGTCPGGSQIIDLAGYGATANCYEGSGPAPAPSNTNSVSRSSAGCTDANNNSSDFTAGSPGPRNSSTAHHSC
jgi:beta-lactamase superfamily II metal-dependent hydrolase